VWNTAYRRAGCRGGPATPETWYGRSAKSCRLAYARPAKSPPQREGGDLRPRQDSNLRPSA
jgi:hypothetical protein